MRIVTPRMLLTPATAELMTLEMTNPDALGECLEAEISVSWPPEILRDALPWFHSQLTADPKKRGWLGWYGVVRQASDGPAVLAVSAGFTGPPVDETVEVGYSVLPEFQGRGYATEMVGALIAWAQEQSPDIHIFADVAHDNPASRRVLTKLGFVQAGTASEPNYLRFEHR